MGSSLSSNIKRNQPDKIEPKNFDCERIPCDTDPEFNESYLKSHKMLHSISTTFKQPPAQYMEETLKETNKQITDCFNTANAYGFNIVELVKERLTFSTEEYNIPNFDLETYIKYNKDLPENVLRNDSNNDASSEPYITQSSPNKSNTICNDNDNNNEVDVQ